MRLYSVGLYFQISLIAHFFLILILILALLQSFLCVKDAVMQVLGPPTESPLLRSPALDLYGIISLPPPSLPKSVLPISRMVLAVL